MISVLIEELSRDELARTPIPIERVIDFTSAYWDGGALNYITPGGPVTQGRLHALYSGTTVDGKVRLLSRKDFQTTPDGWVIDIGAPAELTILLALCSDRYRGQLLRCHESAVKAILRQMQRSCVEHSVGGQSRTGPGLLFAVVPPNLGHSEAPSVKSTIFTPNLRVSNTGTVSRYQMTEMRTLENSVSLSKHYTKALVDRLANDVGLQINCELPTTFEIVGMPSAHAFRLGEGHEKASLITELFGGPSANQFAIWAREGSDGGWGRDNADALLHFSKRRLRAREQLVGSTEQRKVCQHPANEEVGSEGTVAKYSIQKHRCNQ